MSKLPNYILITGFTLWNDLDDSSLEPRETNEISFNSLTSNKWCEKVSESRLDTSMAFSLLGELVTAEGSASYLNGNSTSVSECSVHAHYKCFTRTKSLKMENHLAPGKINYIDVAKLGADGKATHFISSILYGASATLTLKANKTQSTKTSDIQNKLQVSAQQLMEKGLNGQFDIELIKNKEKSEDYFECRFQSEGFALEPDMSLPGDVGQVAAANSNSFNAFLNFFRVLNGKNISKDKDGKPLGVAQRLWLTPLVRLEGCKNTAPVYYPLKNAENILSDFASLMDKFDELMVKAIDLQNDPTAKKLTVFHDKIDRFVDKIRQKRLNLRQKIKNKIVKIRSNHSASIDLLKELYQKVLNSPFNPQHLTKWIDEDKTAELERIKGFINQLSQSISEDKLVILPTKQEVTKIITNESKPTSVHFVFTSLADKELLLDAMEAKNPSKIDPQKDDRQNGVVEFVVYTNVCFIILIFFFKLFLSVLYYRKS